MASVYKYINDVPGIRSIIGFHQIGFNMVAIRLQTTFLVMQRLQAPFFFNFFLSRDVLSSFISFPAETPLGKPARRRRRAWFTLSTAPNPPKIRLPSPTVARSVIAGKMLQRWQLWSLKRKASGKKEKKKFVPCDDKTSFIRIHHAGQFGGARRT